MDLLFDNPEFGNSSIQAHRVNLDIGEVCSLSLGRGL
jgi:hypothetical protein